MEISLKNKNIFTSEVQELLRAFFLVGFFDESLLIGSWVMPLYQEAFGISYVLRTMDIDFAVKFVFSERAEKVDLEKVITDLGYIPVVMRSGIRRFTRENFTVEFVAHRKGGRNNQVVSIRKWNIQHHPFLLLIFFSASPSQQILETSR
ncbi:MAG TPA: GSU2403 family nucleotidyltransferase fold protein [Thermodesulfovibrionales bacterium]|nr:GSU2403 family nucleotidyltransferase fold protein [Thermodesulfovibrionales bacterium]